MAEPNGNSVVTGKDKLGKFVKGHGYSKGRPKGARSLLSEKFLQDFHKQWLKSGKKVLEKVATEHPDLFLKIAGSILPKVLDIDTKLNVDIKSTYAIECADFAAAYKLIGARPPQLIEAAPIQDDQNDG